MAKCQENVEFIILDMDTQFGAFVLKTYTVITEDPAYVVVTDCTDTCLLNTDYIIGKVYSIQVKDLTIKFSGELDHQEVCNAKLPYENNYKLYLGKCGQ